MTPPANLSGRLIPVPAAVPAATVPETLVGLALGLALSVTFFAVEPLRRGDAWGFAYGRTFDRLLLTGALGSVFAAAAAQARRTGGFALLLQGLDRPALKEAGLLFAAGLWALLSALDHPSLGAWGFVPAWGTLLWSFSALKASWRRGTHWLLVSRFMRLPALLAPALTQWLLAGLWDAGGFQGLRSLAVLASWAAVFVWSMELTVPELWTQPPIPRPAPPPPEPEFIRFETEDAAALPDRRDLEGPESLVETGTFRVDIERAARKLGKFQLQDATAFLVPWLRAAVASGASRVEAQAVGGDLELRFDGRPLPAGVLHDPYSGLLGGDSGEAARQVAIGLLALMRLAPAAVEIVSGHGAARRRARAPADAADAAPEAGTDTVLRARLTGLEAGQRRASAALEHLRESYGMAETALSIGTAAVPDPARAAMPLGDWRSQYGRGTALPQPGIATTARLRFYFLGALVEEVLLPDAPVALYFAASDRYTLNISQSAVVDDTVRRDAVERSLKLKEAVEKSAGAVHPEAGSDFRWGPASWVWAAWLAAIAASAFFTGL